MGHETVPQICPFYILLPFAAARPHDPTGHRLLSLYR